MWGCVVITAVFNTTANPHVRVTKICLCTCGRWTASLWCHPLVYTCIEVYRLVSQWEPSWTSGWFWNWKIQYMYVRKDLEIGSDLENGPCLHTHWQATLGYKTGAIPSAFSLKVRPIQTKWKLLISNLDLAKISNQWNADCRMQVFDTFHSLKICS